MTDKELLSYHSPEMETLNLRGKQSLLNASADAGVQRTLEPMFEHLQSKWDD